MKYLALCIATLGACVQGFEGPPTKVKILLETGSVGAWAGGGNGATALPGAKSLADGAATTFESFSTALNACTKESCDVFFNFHTNYSFHHNAGAFGLARAQLIPDLDCDKADGRVKCFSAYATSDNTNKVDGLPHQLPVNAGTALVKVLWQTPFTESTFSVFADLTYGSDIKYNSDIIGAHLHTGSDVKNGPVNIVFCGSSPLPPPLQLHGACLTS